MFRSSSTRTGMLVAWIVFELAAVLVPNIGPGQALARSANTKTSYRDSVEHAPGQDPGEAEGIPAVRLVWFDPTNAAERVFGPMASEVRTVLGGMGVAAHWRRGTGAVAQGEASVILVASEPRSNGLSPHVMGATHKAGPTRAVWIYLPNVARTLWPTWSARQRLSSRNWRALGRALGRVAAHEIVHAVAPALPHRGTGLMSRSLSRTSLLAHRIRVHPLVAQRVRSNLAAARGTLFVLRSQARGAGLMNARADFDARRSRDAHHAPLGDGSGATHGSSGQRDVP